VGLTVPVFASGFTTHLPSASHDLYSLLTAFIFANYCATQQLVPEPERLGTGIMKDC
jgi:hypothetical protein